MFENKNIGFYFRDDVWAIAWGNKNEMTDFDKNELSKYDPLVLPEKEKMIFNFQDEQAVHGFGWTHNFHSPNPGIWTEGNISTLLFRFNNKTNEDYIIKIKLGSLITEKNKPINFDKLKHNPPSQTMEPVKVYACVLMGWKYSSFKNNIHKYGSAYHGGKGKVGYFELKGLSTIDIDTEEDFKLAEKIVLIYIYNCLLS